MNKKFFYMVLLLVATTTIVAQNPTTYHTRVDSSRMDIRERLVQLALQNPNFEIADRRIAVTDYQLRKAKGEWLSVVSGQINLNELTIRPKGSTNQVYYPLYNVGVSIPLNFYTQRKNDIKIAQENMSIAQAEKNETYRAIRAQVLTKYEDYLMFKDQLELQSRVTQDAYLNYKKNEQDFADGIGMVDDYNKAFGLYAEQQHKKLESQRNFNVAKLALEQIIGMSIDEVLGKK